MYKTLVCEISKTREKQVHEKSLDDKILNVYPKFWAIVKLGYGYFDLDENSFFVTTYDV